jgi:hypothetical protein
MPWPIPGGSGHSNKAHSIDLVAVTFSAGQITSSYIPANATSGPLFASSGGTLVAAIKMAGSYSAGDFHITTGPFNTVLITDPQSSARMWSAVRPAVTAPARPQ